jgi:hypothetical protein
MLYKQKISRAVFILCFPALYMLLFSGNFAKKSYNYEQDG